MLPCHGKTKVPRGYCDLGGDKCLEYLPTNFCWGGTSRVHRCCVLALSMEKRQDTSARNYSKRQNCELARRTKE